MLYKNTIKFGATKYFPLWTHICHLVFLISIVVKPTLNAAESKVEDNFLNNTLAQILPGNIFNQKPTSPLDSFEVFQKKSEENIIWLTFWQYQTYRYPLFVQVFNKNIQDIYLTFPSFFLHDKIHQLLIEKWGKQDFYGHSNLSAIYRWNKLGSLNATAIYEANCSITCFPVSLAMHLNNLKDSKIIPLWQQFHQIGIEKRKNKKK